MRKYITKIRSFLEIKHPKCTACNRRIGILDRPERCSLCDKAICSSCIVNERFCETCANKMPKYYRERYLSLNWLSVLFWLFIGFSMMGLAWWLYPGWLLEGILANVIALIFPLIVLFTGLFIALIAPLVPKPGTWLFYYRMKNDEFRDRLIEKIEGRSAEKGFNFSRFLFNIKEKIIEWQKKTKFISVYILGLLLNLLVFGALVVYFNAEEVFADTYASNFAGYIFLFSVVVNFLTIFLAAAFYSKKSKNNILNRLIIEFLSWAYAFIFPLGFVGLIFGIIIQFQYLPALATDAGVALIEGSQALFRISTLLISVLQLFLLFKKPDLDWKKNNESKPEFKITFIRSTYSKMRWLVAGFFVLMVIIAYILSVLVIIIDPFYVFNITGYVMNFVYLFFIFGAMKLVRYKHWVKGKIRISNDVVAKIGAAILILNIIPTMATIQATNSDLDSQFAEVFGEDWELKIEGSGIPTRRLAYSSWDAYFGYSRVPSNAYYGLTYTTDHPRYVIDPISGVLVSNGSVKNTNITHEFKFDLYLPAGRENEYFPVNLTPGDGHSKKYPLVLMIHGLGTDRGTMNANVSSQILANLGYAVCDISYGDVGAYNASDTNSTLEKGYDVPDMIFQIARFLQYIENNSDYYHVDVSRTSVVGRSWGGFLSLILSYGYQHPFFAGNYSSTLNISSVIVFYPASKVMSVGDKIFEIGDMFDLISKKTPIFRGSSENQSANFNPQWIYFDPLTLSSKQFGVSKLPNTLIFHGTHDMIVPPGWSRDFEAHLKRENRTVIAGYYPFGCHGFDGLPWSHYGQSTLYYLTRFIQLSNI